MDRRLKRASKSGSGYAEEDVNTFDCGAHTQKQSKAVEGSFGSDLGTNGRREALGIGGERVGEEENFVDIVTMLASLGKSEDVKKVDGDKSTSELQRESSVPSDTTISPTEITPSMASQNIRESPNTAAPSSEQEHHNPESINYRWKPLRPEYENDKPHRYIWEPLSRLHAVLCQEAADQDEGALFHGPVYFEKGGFTMQLYPLLAGINVVVNCRAKARYDKFGRIRRRTNSAEINTPVQQLPESTPANVEIQELLSPFTPTSLNPVQSRVIYLFRVVRNFAWPMPTAQQRMEIKQFTELYGESLDKFLSDYDKAIEISKMEMAATLAPFDTVEYVSALGVISVTLQDVHIALAQDLSPEDVNFVQREAWQLFGSDPPTSRLNPEVQAWAAFLVRSPCLVPFLARCKKYFEKEKYGMLPIQKKTPTKTPAPKIPLVQPNQQMDPSPQTSQNAKPSSYIPLQQVKQLDQYMSLAQMPAQGQPPQMPQIRQQMSLSRLLNSSSQMSAVHQEYSQPQYHPPPQILDTSSQMHAVLQAYPQPQYRSPYPALSQVSHPTPQIIAQSQASLQPPYSFPSTDHLTPEEIIELFDLQARSLGTNPQLLINYLVEKRGSTNTAQPQIHSPLPRPPPNVPHLFIGMTRVPDMPFPLLSPTLTTTEALSEEIATPLSSLSLSPSDEVDLKKSAHSNLANRETLLELYPSLEGLTNTQIRRVLILRRENPRAKLQDVIVMVVRERNALDVVFLPEKVHFYYPNLTMEDLSDAGKRELVELCWKEPNTVYEVLFARVVRGVNGVRYARVEDVSRENDQLEEG